jgi:hypothetical protein
MFAVEFLPTVVSFRGGREDFEDGSGIEQRSLVPIEELWFAADNQGIRVGVNAGRCDVAAVVFAFAPGLMVAFEVLLPGDARDSGAWTWQTQDQAAMSMPSQLRGAVA